MSKICHFFFYEGYVGVAPTVANVARLMAQDGYVVNIYGTENKYASPGDLKENIHIYYFRKASKTLGFLEKFGFKQLIPIVQLMIYAIACLAVISKSLMQPRIKTINIAVDVNGAFVALIFYYLFHQKFLFLSLELREPERFNPLIYNLSIQAYKKAEAVLIQDEDRFEILCRQYGYKHPQVFYLPNSPLMDDTADAQIKNQQHNFFRKKFTLTLEQYPLILVQAGMIDDTTLPKPLAHAFNGIDNCALVLHDRFPKSEDSPYLKKLKEINSKNLFLSLEPLPYDQVDKIYNSSTICIAFYDGHNDDYSAIAKASGKLAHALKCSKPVLVNDLPSLSRLINQYECGIVIKDPWSPQEFTAAINQIMAHYDDYSQRARRCFECEFDLASKMKDVMDFITVKF